MNDFMQFNAISKRISAMNCDTADDTSEEGKLLDCVRDDSVTYASTRDLEPPMPPPPPPLLDDDDDDDDECELYAESSTETLVNPVSVTIHSSEGYVSFILFYFFFAFVNFELVNHFPFLFFFLTVIVTANEHTFNETRRFRYE